MYLLAKKHMNLDNIQLNFNKLNRERTLLIKLGWDAYKTVYGEKPFWLCHLATILRG